MGRISVGISGWTYAGWRGDFYPAGLAQRLELSYAAERLTSIEINGSFYSLQRPSSYASWRAQTPDDFMFAVKGGRFITHMKKLRDVDIALANFFASGPLGLGPKLGPLLWQLPEQLPYDAERLDDFFSRLPRTTSEAAELATHHDGKVPDDRALTTTEEDRPLRHALEFRSRTYCTDEAFELMRGHDIGCVVADSAGRWPMAPLDKAVTSDFVYVRLHGDTELYASGYGPDALDRWAERCLAWAEHRDVHVYFDNDAKGFAPHDALALIERVS
jgi:uncharacterized protein YecE (DUF72 family)